MTESPSRDEIAARLEAAEARTEARIAQLSAAMELRSAGSDHKIDVVANKIDDLVGAVSEMKADYKETRKAIWAVGIGAVIAVLVLVVGLWVAGLNVQANMLAIFQAGLGVRTVTQATEPPRSATSNPQTAPASSAVKSTAPTGK